MSLARGGGRRAALATAALGVAVAVVAIWVGKDAALEWWHLRQLREGDADARLRAAEALGEMRSARAAPHLVAFLMRIVRANFDEWARRQPGDMITYIGPGYEFFGERGKRVQVAILKVGKPAEPELIRALAFDVSENVGSAGMVIGCALETLRRLDPELWDEPFSRTDEPTQDARQRGEPPEALTTIVLRRIAGDDAQPAEMRSAARDALAAREKLR
ncbi:MAG: hypothetical protein HY721_18460 [Planctomycetes bacterium]|nr:hypothetical protein [Planctomycetota bacterium]